MGILNIMTTKLNAAPIANMGTCLDLRVFLTMREAAVHIGIIAT
jgi:hypothetical protein